MLFFIDEKEYFALVQERRTKLLLVPQHKYEHYKYGQHYKKIRPDSSDFISLYICSNGNSIVTTVVFVGLRVSLETLPTCCWSNGPTSLNT
jgi:hypothetical protein